MAAVATPVHGHWAWDARGDGRAVRVSTHPESGLLNLSFWRDDTCVGTARLRPDEAAALVTGLSDGLATLAARPRVVAPDATALADLEARLRRLEQRPSPWRRVSTAVTGWVVRKAARGGRQTAQPASAEAAAPRLISSSMLLARCRSVSKSTSTAT